MKLNTFSLRFNDAEFDEGSYQKEIALKLGSVHHEISISNRDIGNIFPEVIKHTERPILRTAPAPLFLLSRLVNKSGYKVVVTGEGADEVLGGYDIFREARFRRFIAENPTSPKIEEHLEKLYPWMARTPGKAPAFARAFFSRNLDMADPFLSHRARWDSTSTIFNMFSKEFKESFRSKRPSENLKKALPDNFMKWPGLCRDQWIEYTTLLSGYILSAQGDRMLMANSVEGRFPFLDHRLGEFANFLPPELKLNRYNEKFIMKKAFGNIIPESIINRPKQPYRAPDIHSFFYKDGKADWLEDLTSESILKEAGIFQPVAVNKLLEKCKRSIDHKTGNTDNMRLAGVLSTMLCYQYFIKDESYKKQFIKEPLIVKRL